MKRQRWLSKNRGGGRQQQSQRPPPLRDMPGPAAAAPPGPKSPLSRLVLEGNVQSQAQPQYSDTVGIHRSGSNTGFDAGVAGQWNANVANSVMDRQSRHDPSISGPPKSHSGQRITQPSGGNANIDLSWGGQPQQRQQLAQPPRMPGSAGAQGQYGGTSQGMNYSAQAYADPRHARAPSPGSAQRRSLSCPMGRDDSSSARLQQAAPYGASPMQQMQPGVMRSGSRGLLGASPSPMQHNGFGGAGPSSQCGGDFMAAGAAHGRPGVFRPPGGQSSLVFG